MRLSEYNYHIHCGHNNGYCSYCNAITKEGGVEPDAKNYTCPDCNNPTLMGIEMAFITDAIGVVEDTDPTRDEYEYDEYYDKPFEDKMTELQLSLDNEQDSYTEHDDEYGI